MNGIYVYTLLGSGSYRHSSPTGIHRSDFPSQQLRVLTSHSDLKAVALSRLQDSSQSLILLGGSVQPALLLFTIRGQQGPKCPGKEGERCLAPGEWEEMSQVLFTLKSIPVARYCLGTNACFMFFCANPKKAGSLILMHLPWLFIPLGLRNLLGKRRGLQE